MLSCWGGKHTMEVLSPAGSRALLGSQHLGHQRLALPSAATGQFQVLSWDVRNISCK